MHRFRCDWRRKKKKRLVQIIKIDVIKQMHKQNDGTKRDFSESPFVHRLWSECERSLENAFVKEENVNGQTKKQARSELVIKKSALVRCISTFPHNSVDSSRCSSNNEKKKILQRRKNQVTQRMERDGEKKQCRNFKINCLGGTCRLVVGMSEAAKQQQKLHTFLRSFSRRWRREKSVLVSFYCESLLFRLSSASLMNTNNELISNGSSRVHPFVLFHALSMPARSRHNLYTKRKN